jgi:hypothetical protein
MSNKRKDVASDSEQAALGEGEFIVDLILAEKQTDTGLQYLIKWYTG